MGNFECNNIEDLVFNRSFRDWVLSPASAEAAFWNKWVESNPDKAALVQQSKIIISALQYKFSGLPENELDSEISKTLLRLYEDGDYETTLDKKASGSRRSIIYKSSFKWLAAALFILSATLYFLFNGNVFHKQKSISYDTFLADNKSGIVENVNNSVSAQIIELPDGSKVYLEKGSKLNYAVSFTGLKREVFLTGEAFFEIKKNPAKPFYVYTNSIVTKVLGTSFRVKAFPGDKAVITVRTGKVSVFKSNNFNETAKNKIAEGAVVLTPNQEAEYTLDKNELNKKLVDKPEIIAPPTANAFVFDATPIKEVFKTMQDTYNIPIVFDEDIMAGCSLSARMGNESFYDKLTLICKAINASYEMMDGQIVVVSKGCKSQSFK
ncbi:MAG: FecR domain-containing protein [Chitinophagaceae bacterium]